MLKEELKRSRDVLELGKLLVKALDLDQTVDTLGRWMAHHVAELMQAVEEAEGREKADIEDRCRNAILELWEHISFFPRGHRPFADVEPLLAVIRSLDPDNRAYFYHSEAQMLLSSSEMDEETRQWMELAQGIDYSARLLVSMSLRKAASDLVEDKREWFDLAESLDVDIPMTRLVRVVVDGEKQNEEQRKLEGITRAIEALQNRRERLTAMVKMSSMLVASIDEDIDRLQKMVPS
ncbi:MAG TPA: hypothetical protein VHC00_19315 [Rhizobiaceae bacterium]|nr:hypothetical protein [Rhizobiaceae bacterium]